MLSLTTPRASALAAFALLCAAPARVGAETTLRPDSWYAFSGCWPGVACHDVEVVVGHVLGGDPLYANVAPGAPLRALLFRITSTYQPGATPADRYNYLTLTAQGTYQTAGDGGADLGIPERCSTGGLLPLVARTCDDPFGSWTLDYGSPAPIPFGFGIVARVSPDWSPSGFQVIVRSGTPGTFWSPTSGEERTLVLPLVASTSVVPEPGTVALVGGGLALLAGGAWRRRRA